MRNEEIVNVVASMVNPAKLAADTTCRIKDEDFLKKIDSVLSYYDCGAYKDETREGFRIFASELKKLIQTDTKTQVL